jgi:aryl-alcohol dehydrogenase-like predicted oxidoreductase
MQQRFLTEYFSVSSLGLGCMGLSEFYGPKVDEKESLSLLNHAVDLGVNFLDTADAYGPHHNEQLIGKFLTQTKSRPYIASKFGIVRKPGEYARTINNKPDYVESACNESLQRLGVDCIDLYYAHRINPDQPIEEMMHALSELVRAGKIRHIGLCEVSASTLRRAHAVHKVSAVQSEYSLWERSVESSVLPTCNELGIGFVPYSPLGRGYLTGTYNADTTFEQGDFRASLPRFSAQNIVRNRPMVDEIEKVAKANNCTASQVALAWVLSKGDNIVPIPGTKRARYLELNVASTEINLAPEELNKLDMACADITIVGERYTEEGMKGLNA